MSDLISREDAIKAVTIAALDDRDELEAIKELPSAEAEPTVVRCKTMIPYGDFREWAKRIREDNPNVIVIPFDAEVVSAEAVQGEWIKTVEGNGWNEWWVFKCPFCGATIEDKQYRSWEYNFCPNCGSKMRGGDPE